MKRSPISQFVSGSALVLALAGMTLALPAATALPPGGASPDTAGTSGSVTPKEISAGGTISFRIAGFPPGEVVSVKIDDGDFCSAQGVHGACVVHQQKSGKDGSMSGSFVLPTDLAPGRHWLRFLASAEMSDSAGNYLGVKPYSLRGNSIFTVPAAAESPGGRASAAPGRSGTPKEGERGRSGGTNSGADAGTNGGAHLGDASALEPSQGTDAEKSPGDAPLDTVLVVPAVPTASSAAAQGEPALTSASAPADATPFPWVGAGVLGLSLFLVIGVLGGILLRAGRPGRHP